MKPDKEIKNKNPFKVPEGYFETLTDRIMSAIKESSNEEEKNEDKRVRKFTLRPYLALAAAILGFAMIATFMIRMITGPTKNSTAGMVNELYTELAVEDLDIYLLESELNQTGMTETPALDETVSSEAIIDYLMQENVDIDDIYELL
jgi:hypothetical protein